MKYGTLLRIPDTGELAREADVRFARLKEAGMDSCQLVYKPETYVMEDADVIRACADRYGIEISAQFCGFRDPFGSWDVKDSFKNAGINIPAYQSIRLGYLLSAIPFLQRLGVTDMVVHAGFVPNDPFTESYANMLTAVDWLSKKLSAAGLNLLFETGGESPISLLRLIQDVGADNLFVNLDTGNLILYGFGNPVDAMYTFGHLVRNVHAKDAMPPTIPGKYGKEVPIGTGFVDFPRVLSMLRERGYDRYITIEREIAGGDQDAEIKKAMDWLKGLWEEMK